MLPWPGGSAWRISEALWKGGGGADANGRGSQGVEGLRRRMVVGVDAVGGGDGDGNAGTTTAAGNRNGGGARLRGWGVESMLGGSSSAASGDRARRRD